MLESSDLNFTTIMQDHNNNIFVNTINNFLDLKKKGSTINKKMLIFISLVAHNFEGHFANIVDATTTDTVVSYLGVLLETIQSLSFRILYGLFNL